LVSAQLVGAADDFLALERRIVELFNENRSAMVRVKAAYAPHEEGGIPELVIGSGFFISREGHLLTNASIVNNPVRVWIEHEGVDYTAEIVGVDRPSNVALLRATNLPASFNFVYLLDSPDLPPVGTVVVRISMPLEFPATPEMGLVSGRESRFGDRFFPCKYIRTSILAGPGDGGSAYFDLAGRFLGMQVGSLPEVNSTYVLPARGALRIRDDLLFSGEVKFGWVGFEVREDRTADLGKRIVLAAVFQEGPARAAGLMVGDVLRTIGEYPIRSVDDIRNALFFTRVGQYVTIGVEREGQRREFSVRLTERPENEPFEIISKVELPPNMDVSPVRTAERPSGDEPFVASPPIHERETPPVDEN